jgi:hypothetical protein
MTIDLRKYPRYPCHLKIYITNEQGNSWDMSTLDVSVEGMRILSKHKNLVFEPETLVTIRLEKQRNLEPMIFSGTVRHYSIEQNDDMIFGVSITGLNDESKTRWNYLIEHVRLSTKIV